MTYIYRFFSALLVVFTVVPLYFVLCTVNGIYEMFNNFTYENFKTPSVNVAGAIEKTGLDIRYHFFIKVWSLMISPIIMIFIHFINGVKEIKF